MMFKTPLEVSQEYGISLSTVYDRISKGTYRTDDNGRVLVADVVEVINKPLKIGRPRKNKEKKWKTLLLNN